MSSTPDRAVTADPFDLQRFVVAQEGVYERALAEITAGRKQSHWMWFVFPQYHGLGSSSTSRHFAIKSRDEAGACLEHPILGPRLIECTQAALALDAPTAQEVFGYPDDLKLRSCATLFAAVSPPGSVFERLLAKWYGGERDQKTVDLMT